MIWYINDKFLILEKDIVVGVFRLEKTIGIFS